MIANASHADFLTVGIRRWFRTKFKSQKEQDAEEDATIDRINEERQVRSRKPLTKEGTDAEGKAAS